MTPSSPDAPLFEEVVAAAGRGDERAFAMVWRRFHPPLIRYLRVVAPLESEDVASEVWLSVAQGVDRFSGDERAFGAWLFTIARHRMVDAGRRRTRRVKDVVPLGELDPPTEGDAATAAAIKMELDACLDLVRALPASQAEVVALRVMGGLSVAETAAMVGKSEGAVRVLAHRGLRRIGEQLSAGVELQAVTE